MVGRKQTAGCDIFEGGRCEITPRRFQVKSIIDKVSGLATRRATTWQPGFNGATRRGANTRQTHPEAKTHKHKHTNTHQGANTQQTHPEGKTNRKPGIQQGHNKHRRNFSQSVRTTSQYYAKIEKIQNYKL